MNISSLKQAVAQIPSAFGIWFVHSDEALLVQDLMAAFRQHWQAQGTERQRIDLSGIGDWQQAFLALDNQSLFASTTAAEVHGQVKPNDAVLGQLERFSKNHAGNILVIIFPWQDKKTQNTKWFKSIQACATLVELTLTARQDQLQYLQLEAQKLQITLDENAWRELMQGSENNMLAAQQTLLQLAYFYPPHTTITVEHLQKNHSNQSRYSVYDLTQAALECNSQRALHIFLFLKETGETPSSLLWVLAREMNYLMALQRTQNFAQKCQQLGIWSSRQSLYRNRLKQATTTQTWSVLLLEIDRSIKGASSHHVWDLLLQATLELCAKPLPLQVAAAP